MNQLLAQIRDSLLQDIRYAARNLRRDAGFTTVALLILALGIGANTAVFSVVNTVLLRPLPFADPDRLVWIEDDFATDSVQSEAPKNLSTLTFPVDVFEAMRSLSHSFEDITAYSAFLALGDYKLLGRGAPERLVGLPVAENFFSVLGVRPALGRAFLKEECQRNGRKAVLLSHALWKQRFAGDPGILGQSLTLNQDAVTVVGVLPATFDFGSVFSPGVRVDLYVPAVMDDKRDQGNLLSLIGRLRPGVSIEVARAEFKALAQEFRRARPDRYAGVTAKLSALKDHTSGGTLRRSLLVVWCAAGLILLLVCVNLANLLLVRSAARGREFAVRAALGAGRLRLVRQLMTESLLLSGAGAGLGVVVALALTRYLAASQAIALPLIANLKVDGAALGFTALVAVVSAVLFGLAPSLKVAESGIQSTVRESGRGSGETRDHSAFRSSLVIAEVALACVLLAGAGLLLRSFLRVLDVDTGFQPSRAVALRLDYDHAASQAKSNAFFRELLRQVEAVPGVESASVTDALPMGRNRSWSILPQGRVWPRDQQTAIVNVVAPGYLAAMGMRLRSGRSLAWTDTEVSEPVMLINEALARRAWPGEDPVGKSVQMGPTLFLRIVGIVGDIRESRLEEQGAPAIFLPITQTPNLAGASPTSGGIAYLIIRTGLPFKEVAPGVRAVLQSVNPDLPLKDFQPLQQFVDRVVSARRFLVLMVAAFALLGLLFASLGVYGVISYSVARQTREIGIRIALGASARELQLETVGRTLRLSFTGIVAGTLASFAAARPMRSLLFGVSPSDSATFIGVALVLALVSLIAGYIPARRASRVDPMVALRAD
ncbi:MAG: ABC transporter permease [Vicinamibacteria bacterium]